MAGESPAARWRSDEVYAHLGMVLVQLVFGGYHVLAKVVLTGGANEIVFCVYRDIVALAILAPLAFFNHRRQRLSITHIPLTSRLIVSFFFLGLTGVFGNQLLFIIGLNFTNPTYSSATQPATPVFTFIMAALLGIETVKLASINGLVKVLGAVSCVIGATVMAFYRGPAIIGMMGFYLKVQSGISMNIHPDAFGWLFSSLSEVGPENWHLGVLCLLGGCLCVGICLILQVPVLEKYPDSLSVAAFSYLFGALLMVSTGLLVSRSYSVWILSTSEIIGVLYAGVFASALTFGVTTWSNKILGPSIVSLYSPLQPAMATVLSTVFLKSSVHLGSVIGGLLIIVGLYLVSWARYKERKETEICHMSHMFTPLLQDNCLTRNQ